MGGYGRKGPPGNTRFCHPIESNPPPGLGTDRTNQRYALANPFNQINGPVHHLYLLTKRTGGNAHTLTTHHRNNDKSNASG